MFGRKKKKQKESSYTASGVKKIKLSSLPPEEQARIVASMKRIGDHIAEKYEQIMQDRLERAKAVVDERISTPDNRDDR